MLYDFLDYQNRDTEPVLFTRIETLRLVSRFFEIVDVAQMVSPMNEHTDAYQSKQHLTSTTDAALSGASALASMLLSEDTNKLILREEQLERILSSLRYLFFCFEIALLFIILTTYSPFFVYLIQ
jgi:hypothetical protein